MTAKKQKSQNSPIKLESPIWNKDINPKEFEKAQVEYGSCFANLYKLAVFVETTAQIFRDCLKPKKHGKLPEIDRKKAIIIDANEIRSLDYKFTYRYHSSELWQSVDTYKPVMRILWSARILKPDIERAIGSNAATTFYGRLENALQFFRPNEDISVDVSSDTVMKSVCIIGKPGQKTQHKLEFKPNPSKKWLYAGDQIENGIRWIDSIASELKEWQERLFTPIAESEKAKGAPRIVTDSKEKALHKKECWHSSDFTSVVWYGKEYIFNKTQARCIEFLWKNGSTHETKIGELIDSDSERFRLADTFRTKKRYHPAWGKMVKKISPGIYSLNYKTLK